MLGTQFIREHVMVLILILILAGRHWRSYPPTRPRPSHHGPAPLAAEPVAVQGSPERERRLAQGQGSPVEGRDGTPPRPRRSSLGR